MIQKDDTTLNKAIQHEVTLKQREITYFTYRGVNVEVRHPSDSIHCGWTYYLFLNLSRFADEKPAKKLWLTARDKWGNGRKSYDYEKSYLLTHMEFHGGITWYSKHFTLNDEKVIEVGCDYAHYWDEGRCYSLETVIRDAKRTVDSLHELADYRIWCQGAGTLHDESDGVYVGNAFYSNIYILANRTEDNWLDKELKRLEGNCDEQH